MMVERVDGKSVLEIAAEQNGFQKCVDAQVDINSSDLSNAKTSQKKKRRRKKRKLSDSTISSVGSIEEGASLSCIVEPLSCIVEPPSCVVEPLSCVDASSTKKKKRRKKKKKKKISDSTLGSLGSIKDGASPTCMDVNSTVNQGNDHLQVVINSCELSNVKTIKGKKRRRNKRKLYNSTVNNLRSIQEGAFPTVRVVEGSLVRDCYSDHSNKALDGYLETIMGDEVAGNAISTKNNDDHDEVDINSCDLSSVKRNRGKKRRRKRIKFSDSTMTSSEPIDEGGAPSVLVVEDKSISCLESIKEGASPSVLVVQDSSVRDTSSDPLDEVPACYSDKITREKVAGDGTSFLVAGNISIGKASCECLDGESSYGEQEKNIKMENLEKLTNGHIVEMKTSRQKKRRRKRTKFSDSTMNISEPIEEGGAPSVLVIEDKSISCLESIKEGASPSVLVVQDNLVRDTSSDPLNKVPACYSDKITWEKVAGDGTSFLVAGNISIGKASCECLDGESSYGEQEKNIKMENLEKLTNGHFSEMKTSQRKKRRRKRTKFSDSTRNISEPIEEGGAPSVLAIEDKSISCLESIKEGASSSVLVVQDNSVRDTSSNPLDETPTCYSDKITGEKLARDGTSVLVAGNISIGKASCERLDGESAYAVQEKKIKMENLEELTNGHVVDKNVSWVDLAGKEIEQGNEDKSSTICEDKAFDGASGADSSVDNLESDNLGVKPKLSDEIPSSSVFGVIADDDSLAVAVKEGRLQKLESSPPGSLRKKLLVLDVNGLLADIVPCVSGRYKPDTFVSGKAVFKRPFYNDFLQFCFERFHVAVWSSRTKYSLLPLA